jgi:hypothetical protein
MKISQRFVVLTVLLAALPIAVMAQFETASVLGTVKDGTGAVIVGSKITLENVKTGVLANAVQRFRQLRFHRRSNRDLPPQGGSTDLKQASVPTSP